VGSDDEEQDGRFEAYGAGWVCGSAQDARGEIGGGAGADRRAKVALLQRKEVRRRGGFSRAILANSTTSWGSWKSSSLKVSSIRETGKDPPRRRRGTGLVGNGKEALQKVWGTTAVSWRGRSMGIRGRLSSPLRGKNRGGVVGGGGGGGYPLLFDWCSF